MAVKSRIVVVGLGSIGRRHARLLSARSELAVEWCEADAAAVAAARAELPPPARVHPSFEAMIATRPELVVIATPHQAHAEQTVAALAAGAHVLCEKPMADALPAARRMLAAAGRSDRVLTFGFHLHFHPGLRRLQQLVSGGALGSIVHFHCRVGSYITLVNSRSRHQSRVEGALLMDYTHQPDVLHWMLRQKPAGVYATAGRGGSPELTSNPNFIALDCDYAEPMMATVHLNYLQMPERHDYEVVGDEAWVRLDLNAGRLWIGRRRDSTVKEEQFDTQRDPVYVAEHQAFFEAVAGARPPESPARDAIVSMQIIAAAMESWHRRVRVTLPALPDAAADRTP